MNYIARGLFKNPHINTCFPTLFRKVEISYKRERILLKDGDFLDLDTIKRGHKNAIVLCHGLEGSSKSRYILGMAKYFSERNWDVIAINYRGCSGEMNSKPFFYHSGATGDLEEVLKTTEGYDKVFLIGFSLGATLILRYLATGNFFPKNLQGSSVVSPPCDLKSSSLAISKKENLIYNKYFLRKLKKKIILKHKIFPDIIPLKEIIQCKSLYDFDNCFTAKINGFKDAEDYYEKSSSKPYLHKITIPTLIITPLDDPIMGKECYPVEECKKNPYLTLETPKYGGHIGFATLKNFPYWQEIRIYNFFENLEK
ncbi:MAG: YheT family hydrolase [Fusobacteriaceae bacterium]